MGAALLQESLGLPGPSLHAAVLSRNKALQRGTFGAAGIAQPDYLLTGDLAGSAEWVAERLPVVVKPLSSAGSAGVELVADLDAFHAVAARRATEVPLLVETAVEGLQSAGGTRRRRCRMVPRTSRPRRPAARRTSSR